MALCPSGHESQTNDYCDTCGALMGGAQVTPPSAVAGSGGAGGSGGGGGGAGQDLAATAFLTGEPGGSADPGGACPQCGAARGGRFCEECGFDYEMAALVPPPVATATGAGTGVGAGSGSASSGAPSSAQSPDPLAETSALPEGYDFDAEFEAAEKAFAATSATGAPQHPDAGALSPAEADPGEPAASGAASVLVTADRDYYVAQVDRGDIVEADFPFPRYPGERRFALAGDRIRIGRASASRGIAVEIDLTGPPLDPAVSHLHAQLLRAPDGGWLLVDLNSANGTRLNGAADPVAAETEIPVKAGDRIHLGVWTTLTLTAD
jgi:hypothetical protein